MLPVIYYQDVPGGGVEAVIHVNDSKSYDYFKSVRMLFSWSYGEFGDQCDHVRVTDDNYQSLCIQGVL